MKRMIRIVLCTMSWMAMTAVLSNAQTINKDRMERDIAVAENVLSTLIKQKFEGKRMFIALEISGSYHEGCGVTFTLPPDYTTPIAFRLWGSDNISIYNLDNGS